MKLSSVKSWLTALQGQVRSALQPVHGYLTGLVARLRPGRVIGIDIDGNRLRLLELARTKATLRVESAEVIELPAGTDPGDADALGRVISTQLGEGGRKGAWLACEIPIAEVIQRVVTVPAGSPEELAQMVTFQFDREVPLPAGSASFAYSVLNLSRGGMRTVMLTAVRNQLLDWRSSLARACGLRPRLCTVDAHAAFIASAAVFEQSPDQAKCLLVLRTSSAEVVFGKGRDILFARCLDLGGGATTKAADEHRAEELLSELVRSIDAFRAEWQDEAIANIIVMGNIDRLPELVEKLKQELKLVVEVYDPFCQAGLELAPGLEGKAGSEFAVVLGASLAALSQDRKTIDFWHPGVGQGAVPVLTHKRKLMLGAATGFLALVLTALLALQVHKGTLVGLERQLAEIMPEQGKVKQAHEKLQMLKPWEKPDKNTLETMRQLSTLFPPVGSAYLTKLYISEETGAVLMDGRAKRSDDIYDLILRMNASGYFEDTRPMIGNTDRRQPFPFEFTLSAKASSVGRQK